jgi:hypothetical protein
MLRFLVVGKHLNAPSVQVSTVRKTPHRRMLALMAWPPLCKFNELVQVKGELIQRFLLETSLLSRVLVACRCGLPIVAWYLRR